MRTIPLLMWTRFKIVASIIGDVQSRIIATLFYYTILIPFGLIARYSAGQRVLQNTASTGWLDRSPIPPDIEIAKRQG